MVVFIAPKIIPCGLVWIILKDYLALYREYCYSCCSESEITTRETEALNVLKKIVLKHLIKIGQKDKLVTFTIYKVMGLIKIKKTESVFENFLSFSDWDGIETGFEFIAMLEQAVIAYENRLKERLSLKFWFNYFTLLYQNIKTLIKRRLVTP